MTSPIIISLLWTGHETIGMQRPMERWMAPAGPIHSNWLLFVGDSGSGFTRN